MERFVKDIYRVRVFIYNFWWNGGQVPAVNSILMAFDKGKSCYNAPWQTEWRDKMIEDTRIDVPDSRGKFGPYGGQFVPETLMPALKELIVAYDEAINDPAFVEEFTLPF